MRRCVLSALAFLLTVPALTSCYSMQVIHEDLEALRTEVVGLRAEVGKLRAQVNDGLTLALCSPELRQLLEDVQKECSTPTAPGTVGTCTTKQIRAAVMSADPEHRGRFLKLMSHVAHEVLYLHPGATAVVPYRLERLDRLTRPALLTRTIFLVVSSPEGGEPEAIRRAEQVESLLDVRGIPRSAIRRWLYQFPANRTDILRQADLPGLSESKELFRGVWVFRADC
jgi:hypothetical protein